MAQVYVLVTLKANATTNKKRRAAAENGRHQSQSAATSMADTTADIEKRTSSSALIERYDHSIAVAGQYQAE